LQEIAATCLYIAAKLEEIYPPGVDHFSTTPEEPMTDEYLQNLEIDIMNTLNWNCTVPT